MAFPTADQLGTLVSTGTSGGFWDFVGMSGLALIVSSVLLAFVYLWATFFRNATLNTYVKQELYEVFISAILVVLIGIAITGFASLTVGVFLPDNFTPKDVTPDMSIYVAAGHYFDAVEKDMSAWLNMNYVMNVYVDQIASITPYARPLGVGLVASPLAGLASPVKQLLYNMTVALSIAFVINHAQYVVYVFSLLAFLKYYLPLGIFLRCFTPTRRLGGTLIGIAVAFMLFFPLLTLVTYTIFYNKASGPIVSFTSALGDYFNDATTGSFSDSFKNFNENNFSGAGGAVGNMITGAFGGIGTILQETMGTMFLGLMMIPISVVSIAFAIGFVTPAINILLFTQVARSLSKSFGDELDVSSLTRMI